jgi:NADH dehydrogenase
MILVTGGTGFIGRALIRYLTTSGNQVRTLVQPSKKSPNLPRGVPVEAVVTSILDQRGVLAAMKGIKTVVHLVSGESKGSKSDLLQNDILPAKVVAEAAYEAGVQRIIFLSHLGADRASAFPVLKAKGIAENYVENSGTPYTIIRSGLVFGPGDHFTSAIHTAIQAFPIVFILPGDGSTHLQPIFIEDVCAALTWFMDDERSINQTIEIGGPEYLTFKEIVNKIAAVIHQPKKMISVNPAYLRGLTVFMEDLLPAFPLTTFWLDYLASDRTTAIDRLPRLLGLLPARLGSKLDYLTSMKSPKRILRVFKKK